MGATYPAPSSGKGLTVSFALVNVGVKYAPLVQDSRTKGHYVDPGSGGPVKQQYVNEAGEVVKPISAYDHASGPIVLDAEEKAALESERDKRLNLQAFVELDSIDPLYFERTYLVWPEKGNESGYDLLCEVLAESDNKGLVGTTVLTKATVTVLLRYGQGCLLMQVLSYDANVNWGNHRLVTQAAGERPRPAPELVEMAMGVFSNLPTEFDLSGVTDEFDERLRAAIEAKAEGKPIAAAPEAEPTSNLDLMEALKASVAAATKKSEPKAKRTRKVAA